MARREREAETKKTKQHSYQQHSENECKQCAYFMLTSRKTCWNTRTTQIHNNTYTVNGWVIETHRFIYRFLKCWFSPTFHWRFSIPFHSTEMYQRYYSCCCCSLFPRLLRSYRWFSLFENEREVNAPFELSKEHQHVRSSVYISIYHMVQ